MLVRMRRNTGGPDGIACEVGGVYDLPDPLALQWIRNGRAEPVDGPAPVDSNAMTVNGDPVVQHAEPPKRKRR